jgi:F0F1-type ATP synthase alpha subunit
MLLHCYFDCVTAAAAGEWVRDEGGHSLVVLDDLSPPSIEWT